MTNYSDSTPLLHVGDSSFEDWYESHPKACGGDKQLARDAYAAGMGDPLVTYATDAPPTLARLVLDYCHAKVMLEIAERTPDPQWNGTRLRDARERSDKALVAMHAAASSIPDKPDKV